jgi:glutamate synthase domain-containing protein 1/glutamate synthase domain-containing protein 3
MSYWQYAARFGQPVIKDGCGIFGVTRKKDAPKISNLIAVKGIDCVRYRGSNLGAGYASFDSSQDFGKRPYIIKAFVRSDAVAKYVEERFSSLGPLKDAQTFIPNGSNRKQRFGIWQANLWKSDCDTELEEIVDQINIALLSDHRTDGRVFSFGRFVEVYKEVGYPLDVARLWNLNSEIKHADLWIAHTRQPTNSPGTLPIWSHPFASLNCAIVHNGDISSFGANIEQLKSWGIKSHVGTDSEIIARLLDRLIRVEGLSVIEAATVLTNPYERDISEDTLRLLLKYKSARLDGPFAVVAGYSDGTDTYMIALTDRSKFRPILIGEDEYCYYVASEENEIRSISRHARVWTPAPGSFFIASVNKGIIEYGRSGNIDVQHNAFNASQSVEEQKNSNASEYDLDASGTGFKEINEFIFRAKKLGWDRVRITNVNGQRYLGIGVSTRENGSHRPFRIEIHGFPGNCLANLNDGASFEIFGNVGDDLADTMHAGSVIVHGNARDVVGQTLQGGHIFVRGAVGNRAAIQMREYKDKRPFLIIGETADDYLGEYIAGGIAVVLNLSDSERAVGKYVGTGMVGGAIYVRGKIKESQIGLPPQSRDIMNYLRASLIEGAISQETFDKISSLEFPSEKQLAPLLPSNLFTRVRSLFFTGKYIKPMLVEYRKLTPTEINFLSEKLYEFFKAFGLDSTLLESVLRSEFTVIQSKEEKDETPLPPQEVPVEE